jgi:uncharacterized protein (DUF58 family)
MPEPLLTERELTRLHRLRLAGARVQRASARGERVARQLGVGQEFAAHRAYTHGDDLRRVDWNVYGRLGQLFTKLFEAPGRLRTVIALDDSPTMDFGARNKWFAARKAAAAAAVVALGGADRVWLARIGETPLSFEGAAEMRLIELLGGWPAPLGNGKSPAALLKLIADGGADTMLMVFSDLQKLEPTLALLHECHKRGGRAVVMAFHAAEELHPTIQGFTRLRPAGFADLKLRVDERMLAQYREEVARWRKAAAHAVQATGAVLVEADSAWPLEPILASLTRSGLLARRS